jgi:hypothetical protein
MACDLEEVNANLDRIATAVEQMAVRYTVQEFLDDIENAFGIASLPVSVFKTVLDLMPSLKAKVDATRIFVIFFENFTRWWPIMTQITAVATSLAIIAASVVTQKILGIADIIAQAIGIMQATALGWKDIIFGDKNIWDDMLMPILKAFISPSQGGTADDETPDIDPALRTQVTVANLINVQNQINAICCDFGGSMQAWEDSAYSVPTPSTPSGIGIPPFSDSYTWGSETTESQKCQASLGIVDWIGNFFAHSSWQDLANAGIGTLSATALSSTVLIIIVSLGIPILVPTSVLIGLFAALLGIGFLLGGTSIFTLIADSIVSNQVNLACILFTSSTTSQARTDFADFLQTNGLNTLLVSIVKLILSDDMLGTLFYTSPGFDWSGYDTSCVACEQECYWEIARGTGTFDLEGGQFTLTSTINPAGNNIIEFFLVNACCNQAPTSITIHSFTGSPNGGFAPYIWAATCPNKTRTVTQATPVVGVYNNHVSITQVKVGFSNQFTMTFSIQNSPTDFYIFIEQ